MGAQQLGQVVEVSHWRSMQKFFIFNKKRNHQDFALAR
jgi:hypothetical protein